MFTSFDTWLGHILYGIYVGACLWIFAELTACIIILITNLFYPFISWQNQCQVREDKAKGEAFCLFILKCMQPITLIVKICLFATMLHGKKMLALGCVQHRSQTNK